MTTRKILTELKNNRQSENASAGGVASYPKGAAKREEILKGLMARLAAGELRNPSLRSIARALGVEAAHILYYFGSREELLQAVIVRWDEDASAIILGDRDPLELTLDMYVAGIRRNLAIPGIVHLYFTFAAEAVDAGHPAHDFFKDRFETVRLALARAIRIEQKSGKIRAALDAELQARLLIALADGLQLQSLVDSHVNAANDLDAAIANMRSA